MSHKSHSSDSNSPIKKKLSKKMEDKTSWMGMGGDKISLQKIVKQYALLNKVVNNLHSAIFVLKFKSKNEFRMEWANERYINWVKSFLKGHFTEEPVQYFRDLLVKEDFDMISRGYDYFVDHPNESFRGIYSRKDGEGRDIWLFINSKVLEFDDHGKPILVANMAIDLTNEIEREMTLKNVLDENLLMKKRFNAAQLTQRQREVLNLIIRGHTNKEIAKELHIRQHTVDTHRKNILARFNLKNSATLVRVAMELGWY